MGVIPTTVRMCIDMIIALSLENEHINNNKN
jgi:hypothetical protein